MYACMCAVNVCDLFTYMPNKSKKFILACFKFFTESVFFKYLIFKLHRIVHRIFQSHFLYLCSLGPTHNIIVYCCITL